MNRTSGNILIGLILCALSASFPAAAASMGEFVRMVRLLAPSGRAAGRVEIEAVPDTIAGTVTLTARNLPPAAIPSITRQVKRAGGTISVERSARAVVMRIAMPFDNIQCRVKVSGKKIRIDIGSGRFLMPESPPLDMNGLLPSSVRQKNDLVALQADIAAGRFDRAMTRLKEIEREQGLGGQIACLLQADVEAMRGRMRTASHKAVGCLDRIMLAVSPLRLVAAVKVRSYDGTLMKKSPRVIVREASRAPLDHAWAYYWALYEKARLTIARGEFEKARRKLVALLRYDAQPVLVKRAAEMLKRLLVQRTIAGDDSSGPEELASRVVEALEVLGADWPGCGRAVLAAANAMLRAGLPVLASSTLLWFLKNTPVSDVDPEILMLLAESFAEAKDTFRAEKTLSFLQSTRPPADVMDRANLLRAKLMLAAGKAEKALEFIGMVKSRLFALETAAVELAARKEWNEALLKGLLERVLTAEDSKNSPLKKDLVLQIADAAFAAGQTGLATEAWSWFVTNARSDPRCNMARYRILRAGGPAGECSAGDTEDPWVRAAELFAKPQRPAKVGGAK
ncbi:MAG: hypothetical protein D6806_01250 [Deltaproteobacteria bacterium]|nr:MAG: hypothetical protein D6806_01250 [Deltaproteobacteria bacterium]